MSKSANFASLVEIVGELTLSSLQMSNYLMDQSGHGYANRFVSEDIKFCCLERGAS